MSRPAKYTLIETNEDLRKIIDEQANAHWVSFDTGIYRRKKVSCSALSIQLAFESGTFY
ncbi:MAG: hypothetical protein R2769_11685 [Saprospiraceae bacterium]